VPTTTTNAAASAPVQQPDVIGLVPALARVKLETLPATVRSLVNPAALRAEADRAENVVQHFIAILCAVAAQVPRWPIVDDFPKPRTGTGARVAVA
jgi:hypothetical protein